MATRNIKVKMQQRSDTAANWKSKNPVLAAGEIGYDTTNKITKIGDGTSRWNELECFAKQPKITLENSTWAEIAEIAKSWRAPLVFNVGDEKKITLTTGEEITLVILGFNHDDWYDEEYDEDNTSPITFGMKHCLATRYPMNPTNTNNTGWENSQMRASTMATLFNQLPADLRSIIKPASKPTSAGNKSTTIKWTHDKLFLLSDKEVTGTEATTYSYEGTQYEYFKHSNERRVKGLDNGNGSAYPWWLRSPSVGSVGDFRYVTSFGGVTGNGASGAFGVSFGFCI